MTTEAMEPTKMETLSMITAASGIRSNSPQTGRQRLVTFASKKKPSVQFSASTVGVIVTLSSMSIEIGRSGGVEFTRLSVKLRMKIK